MGEDFALGVAAAADGACVAVGSFVGSLAIGDEAPAFAAAGARDGFVARLADDGNLQWARRCGGASDDEVRAVASFANGACVAVGSFIHGATFTGAAEPITLTSAGERDAFVVRYGVDGSLQWVHAIGGTANDTGAGIAALADGSCIVVGSFRNQLTLAAAGGSTSLVASGSDDVFLARYSASGELLWARRDGGSEWDGVRAIAAGDDGGFATTGAFTGSAEFGGPGVVRTLTAVGLGGCLLQPAQCGRRSVGSPINDSTEFRPACRGGNFPSVLTSLRWHGPA